MRRWAIVLLVVTAALFTAVARRSAAPAAWPDNGDQKSLKFSHAFHVTEGLPQGGRDEHDVLR